MKSLFFILLLAFSMSLTAQTDSTHRIEYAANPITIIIPDYVSGETIIKRKAELFTMTYNQNAKTLSLAWTVKCYADSAGKYGAYIGSMIPDYSRESVADNGTAVDPTTGAILQKDSTGNYEMDYMGQYDWFHMVSELHPLHVANLIRNYGAMMQNWDKK